MKIAIVHDWLTGMRGGEKCLEVLCTLYPSADLFTLLHIPGSVSSTIESHSIHTSFIQNLPFVESKYRYYLPLMPLAIERFNFQKYDLIISSSHCVAKSVKPRSGSLHICYCHTPMRYIWDQFDQYFCITKSGLIPWVIMKLLRPWFQRWDSKTSSRVDHYIANSRHVQKRIKKYYQREATVIHPPVDTKRFKPSGHRENEYFLIVSAFAPYKRVDLAVEAFNKLGYHFVIVGEGQDSNSLRRMANSNIRFEGWLDDLSIIEHYANCRAFVFCGEEDFGITLLEAQAMGSPVIALGRGGALETVVPDRKTWKSDTGIPENKTTNPTGVFFYEQTSEDLIRAIHHFELIEPQFDAEKIQRHAAQFDVSIYTDKMKKFIKERLKKHRC
jgi:glycosyltransferase involved in cell wall biosynthesis|tara:strand:- start:9 stop:1166 length:1158 start_codon:yes stop_codon:yes gene_type:complete